MERARKAAPLGAETAIMNVAAVARFAAQPFCCVGVEAAAFYEFLMLDTIIRYGIFAAFGATQGSIDAAVFRRLPCLRTPSAQERRLEE